MPSDINYIIDYAEKRAQNIGIIIRRELAKNIFSLLPILIKLGFSLVFQEFLTSARIMIAITKIIPGLGSL